MSCCLCRIRHLRLLQWFLEPVRSSLFYMMSSIVSLHIDGYDCDHHFYTTASHVWVDGEMRVLVLNKNSDLKDILGGNVLWGLQSWKCPINGPFISGGAVTGYPLPTYSWINSLFQRKLKNSFYIFMTEKRSWQSFELCCVIICYYRETMSLFGILHRGFPKGSFSHMVFLDTRTD